MKQRRLTIASFLVIAILILTVGFADLNDNLLFDGSANVGTDAAQTAFDGNVYFSNAEVGNTDKDTASIITNTVAAEESDTIQFTISSLGLKDQTATVTGTITNKSESFDAKVTLNNIAVAGLNPEKFVVECYDVKSGQQIASSGDNVINYITIAKTTDKNSDGEIDETDYSTHQVKIVVKLLASPNANNFSATIAVRLDVVAIG